MNRTEERPKATIETAGAAWDFTGKTGVNFADGRLVAEYRHEDRTTDRRLWADYLGAITDDSEIEETKMPEANDAPRTVRNAGDNPGRFDRLVLAPSEYFTNDNLRDVLGVALEDGEPAGSWYLGTVESVEHGRTLYPDAVEGCAPLVPFGKAYRAAGGRGFIVEVAELRTHRRAPAGELPADSFGWLLETLYDLAPEADRAELIAEGIDKPGGGYCDDGGASEDYQPGATWSDPSQFTDPHENMGTAAAGIVRELIAARAAVREAEAERDHVAALLGEAEEIALQFYEFVGTNNAEEVDPAELLDLFNAYADTTRPGGGDFRDGIV